MPQPKHLDPSAYAANGGSIGVLLIHGATGSVAETRPMGEYLAARGLAVCCPLLAGHGTLREDLNRVRWQVWANQVETALLELQGLCTSVFVGGVSMGSLLALWLGAQRPEIAGLISMAPCLKIRNRLAPLAAGFRYLLKYPPAGLLEEEVLRDPEAIRRMWCYDQMPMWTTGEFYLLQRQVRKVLNQIHQPILIFQGRFDNWLSPQDAPSLYEGVASTDKTLVWLERSGHNLLVDGERETVWMRSCTWIMDRVPRDLG